MQASEVRNDLTKRTAGCCAIRRLTRMSVCRVSFEPLAVKSWNPGDAIKQACTVDSPIAPMRSVLVGV
jgi:hypothetical protein